VNLFNKLSDKTYILVDFFL